MKKIIYLGIVVLGALLFAAADSSGGLLPENQFIYPLYSKTISLDLENANLNDVLKIFSQQSGLNFIASDEVIDKKITLFLDKVPVEEALERILQANSLTYSIEPGSNIFIVKSSESDAKRTVTHIYKLKYATVFSSKLNNTFAISEDEDDTESGSASTATAGTSEGSVTGIVAAIKTVLSEKGRVVEDPRTNSLIITDTPSRFAAIEETIARLDVPIPQILIEVEMLDISKATADLIGIKPGETPLTFKGAERDIVYPWNQNKLLQKGYVFEEAEYRVGTISAAGLTATLQLLRRQIDTKNLARPRILTLNNETAQIKISTNEAIGIKSIQQASEGSSVTSVEAERVETGVFLTVTPQANLETQEITMAISPRVIEAKVGGTFSGQTFKDPEKRGSKSVLRVLDGETIVIGGLLRNDDKNTKTKVPLVSDIPILGAAFRHKDKSLTDRELVIFITPRIASGTQTEKLAMGKTLSLEFMREQNIPSPRNDAINKALSKFDKR